MSKFRSFICTEEVETYNLSWGTVQWLSDPRVTGSPCMLTGLVTLKAGRHQSSHNHPGISKNIYVLEGRAEVSIEGTQGTERFEVPKGCLVHIQPGQYHSIGNPHGEATVFLAMYEFSGPEAALRAEPGCTVCPPQRR